MTVTGNYLIPCEWIFGWAARLWRLGPPLRTGAFAPKAQHPGWAFGVR